jgi:hypothetical protein
MTVSMARSFLLADDDEVATAHPPGVSLPAVTSRISLVLDDVAIAGQLRLWVPFAVIELDDAAPMPLPNRALLQYISPEGVLHHRGALSFGAAELSRYVTFSPVGTPQLLLARQRLRAELIVPVMLRRENGTVVETTTSDISETGVLLARETRVELGEHVELEISLDVFAPPIPVRAQIVRIDEQGVAAAHYTDISSPSLERIGWRIFEHFLSDRRGAHGLSPR